MLREIQFLLAEGLVHQQHGIARLRRAAALGDNDAKRFVNPAGRAVEDAGDPVGIRVVDEIDLHRVATRVPEGIGHKHRAEGRTADADGQHMGEFEARGGPDGAVMYSARKLFDLSQGAADFGGNCRRRGQLGARSQ